PTQRDQQVAFSEALAGSHGKIEPSNLLHIRDSLQRRGVATVLAGDQVDGTRQGIGTVAHAERTFQYLHTIDTTQVDLGKVEISILPSYDGHAVHEDLHVLSTQATHAQRCTQHIVLRKPHVQFLAQHISEVLCRHPLYLFRIDHVHTLHGPVGTGGLVLARYHQFIQVEELCPLQRVGTWR